MLPPPKRKLSPAVMNEMVGDHLAILKRTRILRLHRTAVYPGKEESVFVIEVVIPNKYTVDELRALGDAAAVLLRYPEYLAAIALPVPHYEAFKLPGEE